MSVLEFQSALESELVYLLEYWLVSVLEFQSVLESE